MAGGNCSIHELQRHQMLGRRRCGIVYVARSACGWLTIADAVGSCCQRPSAGLVSCTPARCDCDSGKQVQLQTEFNAPQGTQPVSKGISPPRYLCVITIIKRAVFVKFQQGGSAECEARRGRQTLEARKAESGRGVLGEGAARGRGSERCLL